MLRAAATTRSVERGDLLTLVRPRHRMRLMTRRDGRPQASPLTGGLDAEGRIVVATYPERAKVANARRDPFGSVVVGSDEWDGLWVQVDGTQGGAGPARGDRRVPPRLVDEG